MTEGESDPLEEHPADWSGTEVPTHPGWEFVVDDMGCPAWKTEDVAPELEDNVTRAIVRIDDTRTMTGDEDVPPEDLEYRLFLLGYGRPLTDDEYLDLPENGTLSNDEVRTIIDAVSGGTPLARDPVEYEIEVATSDDPGELLDIVETVLKGQFIVTENTDLKERFHHGAWTLHLIE